MRNLQSPQQWWFGALVIAICLVQTSDIAFAVPARSRSNHGYSGGSGSGPLTIILVLVWLGVFCTACKVVSASLTDYFARRDRYSAFFALGAVATILAMIVGPIFLGIELFFAIAALAVFFLCAYLFKKPAPPQT
jgi:MFS family permease